MFSKSDKPEEKKVTTENRPMPPAKPSQVPSIISADLEVLGDLKSAGDVQIDGRVKGDIRSHSATISKGARIEGSIYAQSVTISGFVKGQVEAPNVEIKKGADVFGDIIHDALAIESGANFEGACRRLGNTSAASGSGGTSAGDGKPVRAA